MAGQDPAQPLLNDQEVTTAWDRQDVEAESESVHRVSTACNVEQMFEEHPHDVLKFLQTSGVEKLAEFTAEVRLKKNELLLKSFRRGLFFTILSSSNLINLTTIG
jgi:hypothetical protein